MSLIFSLTLGEAKTNFFTAMIGILLIYVFNEGFQVGKGLIALICHENILFL